MISVIQKYIEEKAYVSVYTDPDNTARFIYGRILAVNDIYIVMQPLTLDRKEDGILLKLTEDVFRVDTGGEYEVKMQKLIVHANTILPDFPIENTNIIESVILYAKQNSKVLSIELEKSGIDNIIGIVEKVEDDVVTIEVLDEYGQHDGIAHVKISSISQISCDGENEKIVWTLNQASAHPL